jgi:hypothetical protein
MEQIEKLMTEKRLIRFGLLDGCDDLFNCGALGKGRAVYGTAGQERKILLTRFRLFHEHFEYQVLQHVVATDVDDESDAGLNVRNIGEVLIRSDTDIDTAFDSELVKSKA